MKERKKMKMNNEKDEGVDYSRHLYTNRPGRERIGRGRGEGGGEGGGEDSLSL